jgi:predicted ester cyclase
MASAAPAPSTVTPPSPEEIEAIVRRTYEALNNRDLERGAADVAEDCEYTDVPSGKVWRGPKGYLEYSQSSRAAFSDARAEIVNIACHGDLAFTEFIGRGTHDGPLVGPDGRSIPPTGKRVELRHVEVLQFRGSKIIRGRCFYDTMSLFRQLPIVDGE